MKVLLKIRFVLHTTRRHPRGVGFAAQSILDVEGVMVSASRPVRFTTEERDSGNNRIGVWLGSFFLYYTLLYSLQTGDASGVHKYIIRGGGS
jgi:hypothetical protein